MHRSWLMLDYEMSKVLGLNVYLGCSTGVMAVTRAFPSGSWKFGHFGVEHASVLQSTRLETSVCANEQDRHLIVAFFKSQGDDCVHRLEARLCSWGAGVLLRDAALKDAPEKIWEQVKMSQGLDLNNTAMKGGQGEMALHLTASHGCLAAMEALLQANANPNIQDDLREGPLHHAALAGQAEAVRRLLLARANPYAESDLNETPLDVAGQHPARFLGVSADEVIALLSEATKSFRPAAPSQ